MYPNDLFAKYRPKGVLIDTNLLLLIIVGSYDLRRVSQYSRTEKYTIEDYALIVRILNYFPRRLTTPNILTEVDNLVRQAAPQKEHAKLAEHMLQFVTNSFEILIESQPLMANKLYASIGLTDLGILECAQDILYLTDDFELWGRLERAGRAAININHIRNIIPGTHEAS